MRSSTSSAARVDAKKSSLPPLPIQSGRPTARARKSVELSRSSSQAVAIAPYSSSSASSPLRMLREGEIASESTVISGRSRSKP